MTDDVFRRAAMSGTQDLNDATALKIGCISVENGERSGRSSSSGNDETVENERHLARADRRLTIKEISHVLRNSSASCRTSFSEYFANLSL
jgi:hypothetical protein